MHNLKSMPLSDSSIPMKSNIGYMLTRGGIKTQQQKVQAIIVLNPPNKVKELRHFLRLVQYYCEMWAKCSEMLAPLSDIVVECKDQKTTRKNIVKKKPWHWDSISESEEKQKKTEKSTLKRDLGTGT
jgi:hypothetical protein